MGNGNGVTTNAAPVLPYAAAEPASPGLMHWVGSVFMTYLMVLGALIVSLGVLLLMILLALLVF